LTRLGQEYRRRSFHVRGISFPGERTLDVGCHDGALLASLEGRVRVGVDLEPSAPSEVVWMVQADGCSLPFPAGCYDQILALDVLEHVPDDTGLASELLRVSRPGGRILVTTPAITIRMFPPFLTHWISARWGHRWRRGYSEHRLGELMGGQCSCTIEQWNAPAYRFSYLLLRLLVAIFPPLALRLVDWIARYDARHAQGHHGFYWMWCDVGVEQ
jgi:SAM-dependent methyltransferase